MMHTIILYNTKNNTYHPMPFRPAPKPSENGDVGSFCRHRSIGHHTEGFPSVEDAIRFVKEQKWHFVGSMNWNGIEMPAHIVQLPVLPVVSD